MAVGMIIAAIGLGVGFGLGGKKLFHEEHIGEVVDGGYTIEACKAKMLTQESCSYCWDCKAYACMKTEFELESVARNASNQWNSGCGCGSFSETQQCIYKNGKLEIYSYRPMHKQAVLGTSIPLVLFGGLILGPVFLLIAWLFGEACKSAFSKVSEACGDAYCNIMAKFKTSKNNSDVEKGSPPVSEEVANASPEMVKN
jgi:hypothetical protein